MPKQRKINESLIIQSSDPFQYRDTLAYIDDEKCIVDWKKSNIERIIYGLFAVGMGVFFVSGFWDLNRNDIFAFIGGIVILTVITFLLAILLINVILNTDRKFIFNRLDGTLTMRSSVLNWKPGTITIPFDEARFGIGGTPIAMSLNVRLPNSRFRYLKVRMVRGSIDGMNCLSFFVWYMDKNRPLPPGKDLDPYRERDYLRRKSEGFPPPLYPATIPMPEK